MKKRILSIFIMIVMLLSLLPAIPAAAAISWPAVGGNVTIGGKTYRYEGWTNGGLAFDSSHPAVAYRSGDGYLLWDGNSVMTLNNVNLTGSMLDGADGYVLGMGLGTVVLEGYNRINAYIGAGANDAYGLRFFEYNSESTAYNAIQGSGTLEIDLEHEGFLDNYGDYMSYGIGSIDDLVVEDCYINIQVSSAQESGGYGIRSASDLVVYNAKITADVEADCYACCIEANYDLYAVNATLLGTSDGGYSETLQAGWLDFINAFNNMTLIDCVVRGETCEGNGAGEFYGLYASRNLSMDGTAYLIEFPYQYEDVTRYSVHAKNLFIEESFLYSKEGVMIAGGDAESDGVLELVNTKIAQPTGGKIVAGETSYLADADGEVFDGQYMMITTTYSDVAASAWYAPAAGFTNATGLFTGTGANTFSPDMQMSRAMMMVALARMNGVDTTPAAGQSWYEKGRQWAMQNGVSDGTNPNNVITREQLACMIWKLEGQPSADLSVLDDFNDDHKVSGWAEEGLAWAVSKGIINGKNGNLLDPLATATRAEVAQLMLNYATMK